MKKVSLLLVSLLTVFITSLSVVAFAAPSDENPYKNHYVKEAQALRKQGTAKIVFQFMTRDNAPLPGVIMLYNTTKEKGQEAYADEEPAPETESVPGESAAAKEAGRLEDKGLTPFETIQKNRKAVEYETKYQNDQRGTGSGDGADPDSVRRQQQ